MGDDGTFGFDPSILLGDGSSGQDLTNLGLGGGYFGYPGQDGSQLNFGANPVTFGPDNGLDLSQVLSGMDPTGGSSIGGVNLGGDGSGGDGSAAGGGGSALSALMSALGLKQLGNGGVGQLLMAALGIGSGLFNRTNTQHATDAALSRISDTSNSVTSLLNNNNSLYRPYADMGNSAAARLQAMQGPQNIAGNFQPLGTGRGITLGQLAGH